MVFLRCPRCCSHRLNERCLKLPIDEEDYYVLLRDVTFVESVTMFSSAMFKLLYTVATVAIIVCLIVAGMVSGSCSSDSERFCLDLLSDLTALKVGLASTGVALWLLAYRMLALLRRPYIHIGVLPGGGARGRVNQLGSSSPFFMRLAASYALEFESLVSTLRAAQLESRQHDLAAALHGCDAHAHAQRKLRRSFSHRGHSHRWHIDNATDDENQQQEGAWNAASTAAGVGIAAGTAISAAEIDAAEMAAEMANAAGTIPPAHLPSASSSLPATNQLIIQRKQWIN